MDALTVLYDGSCMVCHGEVHHYKSKDKDNLLVLADISAADFDPAAYNLSREEVNLRMHAISAGGDVFRGVDAFLQIWLRVSPRHLLIPVVRSKALRPLCDFCYDLFAKHIRPRLPKRHCSGGRCGF